MSRVYRVTQLRTDGVHCQESAGTGPAKPQGSSERVLPWQITMDQLIFASLSHTHYWYEVGMLKVPIIYDIGEKPTEILYTCINRHTGTPKQKTRNTQMYNIFGLRVPYYSTVIWSYRTKKETRKSGSLFLFR